MRTTGLAILLTLSELACFGDTGVRVPGEENAPSNWVEPFFILAPDTTRRYQQVCSASAFQNIPADDIYLARLDFFADVPSGVPVGPVQVNLSTTQRAVDGLSANFADNVGQDDTIVFGPSQFGLGAQQGGRNQLVFERPFHYNPANGNLLIDIRVFGGQIIPNLPPWMPPVVYGQNLATDEVSRVFGNDVNATHATRIDSAGFTAILWFFPKPALRMYTHFTEGTNYFFLEWPTCPTVFVLQRSSGLGLGANWVIVPEATNNPTWSFQRYWFPVGSAPPGGFYRLFWNGQ